MVAPNLNPEEGTLRVVELFAGGGGFCLGLEGWDGKSASSGYQKPLRDGDDQYQVVWSNQWERFVATRVGVSRTTSASLSLKIIATV